MAFVNTVETEGMQAGLAGAPPLATVDIWPSLDPTKPFTLQTTGVNNFLGATNQVGVNFNLGLTNSFASDLTFGISNTFGIDTELGGKLTAQAFAGSAEPSRFLSAGAGSLTGGIWTYNGVFISVGPHVESDVRLKTNIIPLSAQECLNKVMKLRPVEFDWIPEAKTKIKNEHEFGLIAQEVAEILPEVVIEAVNPPQILQEDGLMIQDVLEIDYGKISTILISAMQEQQKQIEDLKGTVAELSTKLAECRGA